MVLYASGPEDNKTAAVRPVKAEIREAGSCMPDNILFMTSLISYEIRTVYAYVCIKSLFNRTEYLTSMPEGQRKIV